jgi:hypothetical protein
MGIRINTVTDHQIKDWNDSAAVIATVAPALIALKVVEDYWRKNDASGISTDTWVNKPTGFSFACTNLEGPGAIYLKITPQVAWIHTGGRWSGFMTIPELRQVHLAAFRSIAKCLGATFAAYFADCDDVYDLFHEQKPPRTIEEILKNHYGEPRSDIDEIDIRTAQKRPPVWYLEHLSEKV